MSVATKSARETVEVISKSGRDRDRNLTSMLFLIGLWFSLFFGVMVLVVLIVDTAISGASRFDGDLITGYGSRVSPETTGFRAGILGSVWLMAFTALFAVPLGIAAAIYFEEFSDQTKWYNRVLEVNLQNLAAVPSIVYGLLAVAVMALMGFQQTGVVLGGAIALALLILPVIIITTREALRAVPAEIRQGSLALGATMWQTTWRQTLPSAIPGISTGTILGLSRAIGEAAPLVVVGIAGSVRFDPTGLASQITALPIQIYTLTSESREAYQTAASAAIIVLLVMILSLNGLAIYIRNKFQRSW
ncbi:phosphate ABC transporter permease PstA [Nocardioides sp.]|uniref:phosphate ABC transporter permease PstA n=1 Tax=Nocardioides sp. TaxID=35761 RepID=UPI002B27100F|nr:phosphate ABC transporter permease PstA [Nocardioides sp.]